MMTQAAVCHSIGEPLVIESLQLAPPAAGEVLIEIRASGLCHSDWHHISGDSTPYPFPIVLGHEGAGVVLECGPAVTTVKAGDHVVPLSIAECGVCSNCRVGKTNLCETFFASIGDGSSHFSRAGKPVSAYGGLGTFANHIVVKEMNVARIPKEIPFDLACYAGCGITTGIGAVTHTARVEPGATVVVLGLGGIGLNVVQGARLAGAARIIGVDTNPRREAVARQLGATDFIDPGSLQGELVEHLLAITDGGADYSFECVGRVELMRQALECTRPGWGVSVVVGVAPDGHRLDADPFCLLLGRTWKGAFLGNVKTRSQLPDLLSLYLDGKIDLECLITHRLPLAQINQGFELMQKGECIRAVVTF
jgi:S-(hydroxymethyl)glutathione dehydrogenase/alcohol dehydrogenase